MTDFKELQDAHLTLLARQDAAAGDGLTADAQDYITQVTAASTYIADPGERDLLRAYLRYWAGFIYQQTGVYPKTELRPAEATLVGPSPADTESSTRPPVWPRPDTATSAGCVGALPRAIGPLVIGLLALVVLFLAAAAFLSRSFQAPPGEEIDPGVVVPATPLPPVTRTALPQTPVPAASIDRGNAAQVQALYQADAHTGGALAVAFDPLKPEVASAGADGRVRFWVLPDLTLSRQLDDQRGWVRTLDYSPPGGAAEGLFLTGGNDRALRVYDVESLQLFAEYVPSSANSGFVFAGRFSPDGRLMASGHGDGVARIWDVSSGTENQTVGGATINTRLAQIPSGGAAVHGVAFRADGAYLALALGGTETGVQVVDGTFNTVVCRANAGPALAVAYTPAGDLLAAGTEGGALLLLSPAECANIVQVAAHEGAVNDVAFSPAGDWLVTAGADGTLKMWTPGGELLATLTVGTPVMAVAVAPQGGYIASADGAGRLILWGVP